MVGHVYFKEMMKDDPSIEFGGEHSSHYYFRKNANADSGIIAFVHLLSVMREKGLKASELRKKYFTYPSIEETNFRVDDVWKSIEKIETSYPGAETERFDGLTVRTPEFWLNVRPSSNEPLLRLNLEAKNEDVLAREFERVKNLLS